MADTGSQVHATAYQRQQIWDAKDTLPRELQFVQALNANTSQFSRIMVGPRKTVSLSDSTPQSLAASTSLNFAWNANTIAAGTWTPPPTGVGVVIEMFRGAIQCADASGKLQIVGPAILSHIPGMHVGAAWNPNALPFTYPLLINVMWTLTALTPMPPYLPTDGPYSNGPAVQMILTNTDGAGAHTYNRYIGYVYRYVYDIDTSKEKVYVTGTLT